MKKKRILLFILVAVLSIWLVLSTTFIIIDVYSYRSAPSDKKIRDESLMQKLSSIFNYDFSNKNIDKSQNDSIKTFLEEYISNRDWSENECILISNVYSLKSAIFSYYNIKGYFPQSLDSIYAIKENMLVERFKYDAYFRPIFYRANKDACIFASMGNDGKWNFNEEKFNHLLNDTNTTVFISGCNIVIRMGAPNYKK